MKQLLFLIAITVTATSCMDYSTLSVSKTRTEKSALQDFYSPCCVSCGQRVIVDDNKGQQHALQVNCKIEEVYSWKCTPYELGTQKHILSYQKKKKRVVSKSYYKPVYDTVELKKLYPRVPREEYFDEQLVGKPVIPLSQMDTLLIKKYFELNNNHGCTDKYLSTIRGYIFVTRENPSDLDKKKVLFRVKGRAKRANKK